MSSRLEYVQPGSNPTIIRNLVSVRALLDRAVEESRQAAEFRRTTGVILLDAANERALYEATNHLGLAPKKEFGQQLDSLVAALGDRWDFGQLADVRRLHRARNAIQHDGLGADRDDIELFVDTTRKLVGHIVSAVFGMNIWTMSLGYAITSDLLAEPFFAAEQALKQNEPAECVMALNRALDIIRERTAQVAGESHGWRRRLTTGSSRDLEAYLVSRINAVEDLTLLASLGADASKVIWFQQLSDEAEAATIEEAERAVGYMFWWIVAFETSPFMSDHNRQEAWEKDQRAVRTDANRARILGATAEASHPGPVQIQVRLGDVPPSPEFERWRTGLSRLLGKDPNWKDCYAYVDETGTLHATVHDGTGFDSMRSHLDTILVAVEDEIARDAAKEAAEAAKDSNTIHAYSADVAINGHLLPDWIEDVHLNIDRQIQDSTPAIDFRINERFGGHTGAFSTAITNHPRVERLSYGLFWHLRPVLPVTELAEVLHTFDAEVRQWAETQARSEEAARVREGQFHAAFGDPSDAHN